MTFRNRPVLDRKHRPRWQDELRTQQLVVAGFALAIAVAIGIFGAAAWSAFYDSNLRQVALVHGVPVERGEMERRADIIAAELTATYLDLGSQLGGARDQIIQQQQGTIEQAFSAIASTASDSVVTGMVLDARARELGLAVPDEELQAEVSERRTIPERRQLSLIVVFPEKDEGAPADAEPTEQDWAEARAEADEILSEIQAGADFGDLAAERSDDQTKAQNGLVGWVAETDGVFGDYFTATADAETGEVIGPLQNDVGWYLVKLEDRRAEGPDQVLNDSLADAGVAEAHYAEHVRQELLRDKFREHFAQVVVGRYQPQRQVAQIFLNNDTGAPVPKLRIRHLLAQPIPGAEDQAAATDEQWQAALERAEALRERAIAAHDEDWYDLADESDDSGSRNRGGHLGWFDPASLATQFVPEFAEAATDLRIGDISEPVRSDFGYHIIQVTERRNSAMEQAEQIVARLRDDPDAFADVARTSSEDVTSAEEGGDLGWILHYQYDAVRDRAVFDLDQPGEISDPVVTDAGIYIYQLLDTSEARYVPLRQREQVGNSGFGRWLQELKDQAGIWIDPEFAPSTATAAG